MPNPVIESLSPPFMNFRFEVLLTIDKPFNGMSSPVCSGAFSECSGLDMTMDAHSFNEGGANQQQTHLKGKVTYSQLTLRRGMTPNQHLRIWFDAAGTPGGRWLFGQPTLLADTPLVFSANTEGGTVVFTAFHNEAQISDGARDVLRYELGQLSN